MIKMTELNILDVNPGQLVVNKNKMYIPDFMIGHEEVEWTGKDDKSLERAQKIFDDKIAAGWAAFKETVKNGVKHWEKISKFNAGYNRILLLPITKKLIDGG